MLRVGEFEVHCIVENRFHLDAGGVYGIVPKSIWSKLQQADENNLLPFDTNVFLVKAGCANIIVDAGLGDYLTDRERKLYSCYTPSRLLSGLFVLGLKAEDIDYVLLSHLHWDHVGGAISLKDDQPVPTFPRAKHYVQRDEWEDANNPDERTFGVYFPDRLRAIAEAGLLMLTDGDLEVLPGVKLMKVGGHTRGQMGIEIESKGEKLIYYADNFPSSHHLKVPYVSATDLFPLDTQRFKRDILPRVIDGGWFVAMDHDIEYKVLRLKMDGLKLRVEKMEI